jgi:5-methylcytosine-specific restriction endonuclease McrA
MCKTEIGEEIHHISPQKDANTEGFIGTFHKNHPANLMSLCEKCHVKCHTEPDTKPKKKTVARKKTTKGYAILSSNT